MSKKARVTAAIELEPMTGGLVDTALVVAAIFTVGLVALWFKLDVNRVFDVPKALALKVGGCGIFIVWLAYGLFGRGFPWKSIKVFGAPVGALTVTVMLSTLLSIDPWMSLYGVYERQFGLQGFLGCIGIFVVTATCIRSRRGAVAAMATLAIIGGLMGTYSLLQSAGVDPFGFFAKPHNKVYSTLGNPNFAGNALALIFPISMVLGIVACTVTVSRKHVEPAGQRQTTAVLAALAGFAAIFLIETVPGWRAAVSGSMAADTKRDVLLFADAIAVGLILFAAAAGTWGPLWTRSQSASFCRLMDAFGAGGILASAVAIGVGVYTTRTRGAWVGTAGAVFLGLLFAPLLYRGSKAAFRRARAVYWGFDGALAVGALVAVLAFPGSIFSVTVKSMFYAFDSEHTVYGQGQGTRKYLWSESPRVLLNHQATLERQYRDHDEYASRVTSDAIDDLELPVEATRGESSKAFDSTWRQGAVWLFGIGIETYRYAFMSHKSKKLEALDPMTNHDNPHNNYLYVLASFGIVGILSYMWLLFSLLTVSYRRFTLLVRSPNSLKEDLEAIPIEERAIAFGVLTSFFSYALYSLAGFDSVCCSAFLYLLLGASAVYFDEQVGEPDRNLWVGIKRQWTAFRKNDPAAIPNQAPMGLSIATMAILGLVLAESVSGGWKVHDAEQAFVGDVHHSRDLMSKAEDIKKAIAINPLESFYKQNLGSTFAEIARQRRYQASRLQAEGKSDQAIALVQEAEKYSKKAEAALYAALDHAWAPENVFISLFQLYYAWHKLDLAERALQRGLEHSPHLGAVRANLAILELERGGFAEALKDCKWVIEVDPNSEVALRTCGRASQMLGNIDDAERYLAHAQSVAPNDPAVKQYVLELNRAKALRTSTRTPG